MSKAKTKSEGKCSKRRERNLKWKIIGTEPEAIRTIIIFPTYKSIPLKGYKLGEIRKQDKRNESWEVVNLQNAEVTKMLDTKNSAKWPLTTQNCFDGKKQVVKGHFTCGGAPTGDSGLRRGGCCYSSWVPPGSLLRLWYLFLCVLLGALFLFLEV